MGFRGSADRWQRALLVYFYPPFMPSKIFTTRRQWHNILLMAWMFPFLILTGVLFLAIRGITSVLFIAAGITIVGTMVALIRDMGEKSTYIIRNNEMTLRSGKHEKKFHMDQVMDASLIDRMAARDYIKTRMTGKGITSKADRSRVLKEFIRFCTVDIGITSLTMGIGRGVIDKLPLSKHDLVLLRLKDGTDLLLSPKYNQDLVDSVSRSIGLRPD
jgi:hypothetical protein